MRKFTALALAAGLGLAVTGATAPEAQAGRSFSLHVPGFSLHIGKGYGYYDRRYYHRHKYHKRYYRKRHWGYHKRHRYKRHHWRKHYWKKWR